MIDRLVTLIILSLVSAFVANVITLQNGPMFVFSAFRMTVGSWYANRVKDYAERISIEGITDSQRKMLLRKSKAAKSIGELVSCPFCLGPWLALLLVAIFANDNLIINWLACSGLLYVWLGAINGTK